MTPEQIREHRACRHLQEEAKREWMGNLAPDWKTGLNSLLDLAGSLPEQQQDALLPLIAWCEQLISVRHQYQKSRSDWLLFMPLITAMHEASCPLCIRVNARRKQESEDGQ